MEQRNLLWTTRNKYVAASLASIFNYVATFLQLSIPAGFCTLGIIQLTCRDFRKLVLHSGCVWASKSCPTNDKARNRGFVKSFGAHIKVLDVSNVKTVTEICALVLGCPNLTCLLSRKSLDNKARRDYESSAHVLGPPVSPAGSKIQAKPQFLDMDRLLDILETRNVQRILLANTTFAHDKLYKFLLKVGIGGMWLPPQPYQTAPHDTTTHKKLSFSDLPSTAGAALPVIDGDVFFGSTQTGVGQGARG